MNEAYGRQARVLLGALPHVMSSGAFALKGGTAINMFVRDCPRVSVDVDLTYLPVRPRNESLNEISTVLDQTTKTLGRAFPGSVIACTRVGGMASGLLMRTTEAAVKIEVNTMLRGTVLPATVRELSATARQLFAPESFIAVRTLSTEDLYAGKMCAALD